MGRAWVRLPGAATYTCATCGQTKDAAEFLSGAGYVRAYCKACSVDRVRQWRAEHPDEARERNRARYRDNPKYRAQVGAASKRRRDRLREAGL